MGSAWEGSQYSVVQAALEKPNSVAALYGTLRMSGIFAHHQKDRFVPLDDPPPFDVRIYTMFPQMPDPMPLPSTSPEELQRELVNREANMGDRNPHQDVHGRIYTHKSTSNVSNTIHGVYLTFDVTESFSDSSSIPPPAFDALGTRPIPREWKSLDELQVLDAKGRLSTNDPKPTFISGFIVRQLVK